MTTDSYQPSTPPGLGEAKARFGRYTVTGEGRARDGLLDRTVALRQVEAASADDFQAEARFLARMQGPGLPCVHDFVRDDTGAALVMPAVDAVTLAEAIAMRAEGRSDPAIAGPTACIMTAIRLCDALRIAHQRGVAHGDLTPAAVLLQEDGGISIANWDKAMASAQRPLTQRFCSGAQAAVPVAADGLHGDIRGVGVCLYAAVFGEMPATAEDGWLAASASVTARASDALLAIVGRAMTTSATEGYASVAELRAALVGYLDGQAPRQPARLPMLAARLRAAAVVALLLLVVGGAVVALNWRSISTFAEWGSPLVSEDFTSGDWKTRWVSRGRWEHRDGTMVSAAQRECALLFKERLSPPVAIEYTGRFAKEVRAGDLSVWWCEDQAFALHPDGEVDNARAWFVQAGAYDNSWCCIWQTPERIRFEVNNFVLRPDRDYRFRVEIDSDRLTMSIDGQRMMEHRTLFPIGSGNIGLYTWDPGKAFRDVRIWQKEVPALVSPLSIGDEAFRAGRYDDAADSYGRVAASHRGKDLGAEGLYFQALALHRAGSTALAHKIWQTLPEGLLRNRAECLLIDDLLAQGDMRNAVVRFTAMWEQHPEVRDVLRQRWQVCGQTLRRSRPPRIADMTEWIELRDATFPDDPASRWLVAELFNLQSDWEQTIRRFPDEHRAVAKAMLALGRNAELIATDWALPPERASAHINLGDLETALASRDLDAGVRADLLCKLGRAEGAVEAGPYPAQVYLGGADRLLASDGLGDRANAALIALGRLEEAAGDGVPGSPKSGHNPGAMLLLGRLDDAERHGGDARLQRLLAMIAEGRLDEARAALQDYHPPGNRSSGAPWFSSVVGLGMIHAALGDADALRRALVAGAGITGCWGGRPGLVCAAALDPGKEPALSAMAWRTEAEAWLLVARALRCELAGDRAATAAAWRAFKSLPPLERLVEDHLPSIELESYADWRIAMLSGPSP